MKSFVRRVPRPETRPLARFLALLATVAVVGACSSATHGSGPAEPAPPTSAPIALTAAPGLKMASEPPVTAPSAPVPAADDITIDFPLGQPVVGGVRTAAGTLLASADGGVFALSHAAHFSGSMGGRSLSGPVVALAADPAGSGYWLAGADGGVFAFNRPFFGATGTGHLSRPIAAMAATPSGQGYWLAGADGGVFAYGDAPFLGGVANRPLSHRVVAMATTPDGKGYWLASADGGVFAYGDAPFLGSPASEVLIAPVVGMLPTPSGQGYWLASADGGVFAYGDAAWLGSPLNVGRGAVVAITASPGGYRLVTDSGALLAPGDKPVARPAAPPAPPAVTPSAPADRQVAPTVSRSQRSRTVVTAARAPTPTTVAPTQVQSVAGAPSPTDIAAAMNRARAAAGLAPLAYDGRLAGLASGWSGTMARRNAIGHNDLSGIIAQPSWSAEYSSLGENLFTGALVSAAAVVSAWMGSSAHRFEILLASYDRVGVGIAVSGNRLWVTADFGNGR